MEKKKKKKSSFCFVTLGVHTFQTESWLMCSQDDSGCLELNFRKETLLLWFQTTWTLS